MRDDVARGRPPAAARPPARPGPRSRTGGSRPRRPAARRSAARCRPGRRRSRRSARQPVAAKNSTVRSFGPSRSAQRSGTRARRALMPHLAASRRGCVARRYAAIERGRSRSRSALEVARELVVVVEPPGRGRRDHEVLGAARRAAPQMRDRRGAVGRVVAGVARRPRPAGSARRGGPRSRRCSSSPRLTTSTRAPAGSAPLDERAARARRPRRATAARAGAAPRPRAR